MEPKLPSPNHGPEVRPADFVHNGETASQSSVPETNLGQSIEREVHQGETAPSAEASHAPIVAIPSVPIPVVQNDDSDDTTTLPPVENDTPATANDSELIEREWVDKAKKVIAQTRDDPYRREQEVNKLQADYLYKRYGRKLGSPQ